MATAGSKIDPLVERIIEAWESDPTLGRNRLAAMLGVTHDAVRKKIEKAKLLRAQKPSSPAVAAAQSQQPSESHEKSGDTWHISLPRTRIHTLEELLKHCEVDAVEWEVERWVANKWEVGAKDQSSQIQVTPLYQVKAWLRRRKSAVAARDEINAMLADVARQSPRYERVKYPKPKSGNLLEISLPDIHYGKLAWGEETGWGDYDSKKADTVARAAFTALLQRTSSYFFDRICLVFGNDMLNADNLAGTTTRGTPQDCDTRTPKMFRAARQFAVWAIEQARLIAPVDVLLIPGNHDTNATFYLGEVLEAWFRHAPGVTIDNRPTLRKVYTFGKVAIMFTHGDKGKRKDYPLLMATEARKVWGDAVYCEIHTGDKHQVRLEEQMGVRVRILPSLSGTDAWHAAEGYVGNIRCAEAYVWNHDDGLLGMAYYNVGSREAGN